MWIVAFDIGIKNFAFAILDIDMKKLQNMPFIPCINSMHEIFQVIHIENISLIETDKCTKTNNMNHVFRNLIDVLNSFELLWSSCDVFLVEQQMQYRHASNIRALKLSQHVISYFLIHYGSKTVIEYPAYHKTQIWNAPQKLKKHERKKWAIETVEKLLDKQIEDVNFHDMFSNLTKKDDVSDCILMALAYAFQKK